jgi:hypothetical protein
MQAIAPAACDSRVKPPAKPQQACDNTRDRGGGVNVCSFEKHSFQRLMHKR